ncbi:MAG: Ig-like domain-containing protein [Leptospira sp.]|uniref:Ig-like domain-containing protein n=1 Tax=Leptospira sp. TaxID=178 RepID=UPI0025BBC0F0|nr:Ig-like domain-containing protein [Leptospira sp.]MBL0956328.1 Ig-like domain-containing protein [Leptospira sp.]
MKYVKWSVYLLPLLTFYHCHAKMGSSEDWLAMFVNDDTPKVVSFTPSSGEQSVSPKTNIVILWNQPMEIQSCVTAFSLDPNTKGIFETTDISLKFIPNQELLPGGFVIRLTKQCENKKGKDLDRVYSIPFRVQVEDSPLSPTINSILISVGTYDECLSGGSIADLILQDVNTACSGIPQTTPITLVFSKPMNQTDVSLGFRMEPSTSYHLEWTDSTQVQVQLDAPLQSQTRYQFNLASGISALDGTKIEKPIRFDFYTNEGAKAPEVIGFGLASQLCGIGIQELGTTVGSRWDSNLCFWSKGLAFLPPHHYQFRGGDDGTGGIASSSACADVNTDNFKLFFDEYMDPISVISSSRLTKISPPSSNIRLSTWEWSHCQSAYPFGCKEITYSFAESEASCNGTLFGNNTTGGDFNLASSSTAPNFYPYYEFKLDADVRSANGKKMISPFIIQMEAK